jgi:adenylate cyclase
VGAGVHSGTVWFGAIGEGSHVELTAVGDAVNATARLASMAGAGEVLVTGDAATLAELDPALPRETVELRGKAQLTEIVRLTAR